MALITSTKKGKKLTDLNGRAQNGKYTNYSNSVYQVGNQLQVSKKTGEQDILLIKDGFFEISGLHGLNDGNFEIQTNFTNATKNLVIRANVINSEPCSFMFLNDNQLINNNLVEKNLDGINDMVIAKVTTNSNGEITNVTNQNNQTKTIRPSYKLLPKEIGIPDNNASTIGTSASSFEANIKFYLTKLNNATNNLGGSCSFNMYRCNMQESFLNYMKATGNWHTIGGIWEIDIINFIDNENTIPAFSNIATVVCSRVSSGTGNWKFIITFDSNRIITIINEKGETSDISKVKTIQLGTNAQNTNIVNQITFPSGTTRVEWEIEGQLGLDNQGSTESLDVLLRPNATLNNNDTHWVISRVNSSSNSGVSSSGRTREGNIISGATNKSAITARGTIYKNPCSSLVLSESEGEDWGEFGPATRNMTQSFTRVNQSNINSTSWQLVLFAPTSTRPKHWYQGSIIRLKAFDSKGVEIKF